jgi:hypothetical protein
MVIMEYGFIRKEPFYAVLFSQIEETTILKG